MVKSAVRASSPSSGVLHQEISFPPTTPPANGAESHPEEKISFWEQLISIPEDAWWSGVQGEKGYKVYLYDQDQGGKYLELITHPFDIEWVRAQKGGGSYRAIFNDASGRVVETIRFTIDGPPNRKPPASVQNAPPAAVPPQDSFLSQIVEVMRDNQRETREMMREMMNRTNPAPATNPLGNPMEILKPVLEGVVGVFSSMIPKPGNPLDDLIKMKTLLGDNAPKEDIFTLLQKMRELGLINNGGAGGGKPLLDQLGDVMAVAEKMGLSGGGKTLTESLIGAVPDVIGAIKSGLTEYRILEEKKLETAKFIAVQQQRAGQIQQQIQPQAIPAATPQTYVVPPNGGPATVLPVQPINEPLHPGKSGEAVVQNAEEQVNQLKAKLVESIAQGATGADLYSYLKIAAPAFLNGMCKFDSNGQVVDTVSVDELSMFCAGDPILAQAAQLPRYREALKELLDELRYETMGIEPPEI